jgi:unsaturated rhamnogalacturonyl hydrolase
MRRRVLKQPSDTAETPWSLRVAASALSRYALSQARWHYTDGLLFKAILQLWQYTGDARHWHSVKAYVDRFVNAAGVIDTYSVDEYNIDQINPGNLLFPLYRVTGEERYRTAIWQLREQLRHHPRTQEGGFWHKKIYPFQMWLDGIYMGMPFLSQFAAVFDEPAAFDDIAFQISVIEKHTRDDQTGLLYHGWDENCQQRWANPITGCSPHFWSRAIGWYVMAIVDVLDYFPQEHPARPTILAILDRTVEAVAHVQDEATGLWWQVLDQGGRQGNYLEASGTSMYVYAITKGVRSGTSQRN